MATVRSLIEPFLWEHLEYFTDMVDKGGEDTVFEGVRVLDEPEKFVHGALINATAQLYIHCKKVNDGRAEGVLSRLTKFLTFINDAPCKTWGKLSVLRALASLSDAGLLSCIAPETLETLKIKTDYGDFIDKERATVKGYPSNYLQVGMACAALRFRLGWEGSDCFERLKASLLSVMKTGALDGWMDEQPPFGRFDRYSIIVTSELSDTLALVSAPLPDFASNNLRLAAEHCIFMANEKGDGINYGRSLSCHGDCACLEIIASAFYRGLVSPENTDKAIAYSVKILEKTLDFWYNKEKRSFDIWWNGRSTNRYRQVHRVLEVNLDMAMHLLTTLKNFESAGMADTEAKLALSAPESWICREMTFKNEVGSLAKTVILRKGDTLALLPLIGLGNHCANAAYQPYPSICGLLEGAPEAKMPYLVPQYTLADGTLCRPSQFYDAIETECKDGCVTVRATGTLAAFSSLPPQRASGSFTSVYRFDESGITVSFEANADVKSIETVLGKHGETDAITACGFDESENIPTNGEYDFMTPHGAIVSAALFKKNGNGKVGYKVKI